MYPELLTVTFTCVMQAGFLTIISFETVTFTCVMQAGFLTIISSVQVEFLTIKAQSWVVLNSAGEVEHCGKWKWKDVRYAIPELTARDISTHLGQPVDIALEEEGAVGGVSD